MNKFQLIMPSQSHVIPLLVFALVIILVGLDGYGGITFELSTDAWDIIKTIVPIGFGGGLLNKGLNVYRDRNKKV